MLKPSLKPICFYYTAAKKLFKFSKNYYKTLHIKTTKLERASWFLRSIKENNYSIKNVPEDVTFAKIV